MTLLPDLTALMHSSPSQNAEQSRECRAEITDAESANVTQLLSTQWSPLGFPRGPRAIEE
jgi:hypothetical protein